LVADHQAAVRTALHRLLKEEPVLTVGEAVRAGDLLDQVISTQPDLVLLDWELPGLQGADLLPALNRLGRPLKAVFFSEHTQAREEALTAGADAFVSRREPAEELMNTVRAVVGLSPGFVG
jgi:DNA-binding NarL/FixJ family response regulator